MASAILKSFEDKGIPVSLYQSLLDLKQNEIRKVIFLLAENKETGNLNFKTSLIISLGPLICIFLILLEVI